MRAVEGQYVAYTFFRVDPAWRRLPGSERQAHKDAFAEVVEDFAERFEHLRAYSTAGVRPDCDFFLWKITERYDLLEELGTALNATPLAGWQRWVEIVMHRWLHLPFPLGGSAAGASIPSFFAALLLYLVLAASSRPREGSAEAPPPATPRGDRPKHSSP